MDFLAIERLYSACYLPTIVVHLSSNEINCMDVSKCPQLVQWDDMASSDGMIITSDYGRTEANLAPILSFYHPYGLVQMTTLRADL